MHVPVQFHGNNQYFHCQMVLIAVIQSTLSLQISYRLPIPRFQFLKYLYTKHIGMKPCNKFQAQKEMTKGQTFNEKLSFLLQFGRFFLPFLKIWKNTLYQYMLLLTTHKLPFFWCFCPGLTHIDLLSCSLAQKQSSFFPHANWMCFLCCFLGFFFSHHDLEFTSPIR